MTELVSIDAKRKAKAPRCDFCGQPEHITTLACPRVFAVTYEGEAVTDCAPAPVVFDSDGVPAFGRPCPGCED